MPATDPKPVLDILLRIAAREPSGKGRTSLPVAWASTRGASRQDNQDRLIVGHGTSGLAFAILADGMGGMKEGARAAALTVAAAAAHCACDAASALDRLLEGALRFANEQVYRVLRGEGGAAAVLAARKGSVCYVVHAGDARGYVIPSTDALPIKQITADDTLDAELARLGRRHEGEPDLHRGLVQFVGVGPDLEPHVARVPDGSRGLLLTTDGVHSMPGSVLEWFVRGAAQLQSLPERLVLASEWHGGKDNGTVIVVGLQDDVPTEPIGVADFWVAGERVAVLASHPPAPPAEIAPRHPDRQVDQPVPGRSSPGKRGSSRRPAKRRSRDAEHRNTPRGDERLPLVDFDLPPTKDVMVSAPTPPQHPDAPPQTAAVPAPADEGEAPHTVPTGAEPPPEGKS